VVQLLVSRGKNWFSIGFDSELKGEGELGERRCRKEREIDRGRSGELSPTGGGRRGQGGWWVEVSPHKTDSIWRKHAGNKHYYDRKEGGRDLA